MDEQKSIINLFDYAFWGYSNKDLIEIKNVFEETFNGLVLIRDDEDTWEWLEGKSVPLGYEFDISRKHNWGQGLYDSELIINIKSDNELDIDKMGNILKTILSTTIYYGNKIYMSGNDYQFVVLKKYE